MGFEIYELSPERVKLNVMVYGPPGAGKTTFIATAQDIPELSPMVIANVEGGLLSIVGKKGIKVVDIRSIKEFEELLWVLSEKEKYPEFKDVKSLAIDSGTELQALALGDIVQAAIRKRPTNKDGSPRTVDQLWQEDYGQCTQLLKRLFRMARDLPLHTFVTALPRSVQNAQEQVTEISPNFTPALKESVMGYMDFVWCLTVQNDERFLLTRDRNLYRAKTRGANFAEALGPLVKNPDLAAIYQLLQETEGNNDE